MMKNRDEIVPLMSIAIERGVSAQDSVDGICSSAGSPGKRTHCAILIMSTRSGVAKETVSSG